MAEKKKKNKASITVLGVVVFILVILGAVSVIRFSVGTVKNLTSDEKLKTKYEKLLSTVIMNDPDAFDDITGADIKQLIAISIWTLLENENTPDTYEYVDAGMLVPAADVEKTFTQLFGTDVTVKHCSVDGGEALKFTYDETRKAYIIPITGISPIYTPDVLKIDKKGTTVILTVGYLASTDWVQADDGSMVPPVPSKYMKISLRETADGGSYISSIQSASDVDYITQAQTTENAGQAEDAGEDATETKG